MNWTARDVSLLLILLGAACLSLGGCGRQVSVEERALRRDLRQALREDRFAKAEQLAQRVLSYDREDNGSWGRLVQAQLGQKKYGPAKHTLAEWKRAVPRPPAKFDEYAGKIAVAENDPAAALQRWRAVLSAEPKNKRIIEKVARLEQREKHWREAEAAWTELLELEETAPALLQRAECRRYLRHWVEARADLYRARELAPGDPAAESAFARFEKISKLLPAIRELDKRVAVSPQDPSLLAERALLLLRSEQPDLALEDAEVAIELAPWALRPKLFRGLALLQLGRSEEAAKIPVRPSLKLESLTPEFLETIGRLDSDISLERTTPEFYVTRAWHLNEIGLPGLALVDAENAAKLDPSLAPAYVEQAYALNKLGQAEAALAKVTRATELDPNSPTAWQYKGELNMARGEHDQATTSLSRAFSFSQSPVILERRMQNYRRAGLHEKAEEDSRLLQKIAPQ